MYRVLAKRVSQSRSAGILDLQIFLSLFISLSRILPFLFFQSYYASETSATHFCGWSSRKLGNQDSYVADASLIIYSMLDFHPCSPPLLFPTAPPVSSSTRAHTHSHTVSVKYIYKYVYWFIHGDVQARAIVYHACVDMCVHARVFECMLYDHLRKCG